jgi:hypothetical protein
LTKRWHSPHINFSVNRRAQLARSLFSKTKRIENRQALKVMNAAWAAQGKTSGITWGDLCHIMPALGFTKGYAEDETGRHMIPVWTSES